MCAVGSGSSKKRYQGGGARLSSPERLALLGLPEVVRLSLEGAAMGSVLDAGTGTGVFAEAFAASGMRVTGVDVNEELLRLARAAVPGVEFLAADLEKLPLAERSFDLVFLGLVLHETGDPLQALREARRVARVRVAILEWPRRRQGFGPPLRERLSRTGILRLAKAVGFSAVERLALERLDLYRLAP
jgi:ubiquinone/menaquinone biosynthesis C-methylase UbiE